MSYRYVWYFENGQRQAAKIIGDQAETVGLQLADGTHRASVPFYMTPTPRADGSPSAHAPASDDLPDGDALDAAIRANAGVGEKPDAGDHEDAE